MNQLVLAPDLFLDRQENLSFRDLTNLMEFPFFAISKKPSFETRIYDDGKVRFEVRPGHRGLATIWDKDILIYVASQINRMLNEGQNVGPKVRFHAHDFFKSCGRSTGGRSYEDLVASLDRLQSTSIRTNITTNSGEGERSFFSWIKSGRMTERRLPNGTMGLGMVEVEIEDWVWRQIVEDRKILSIDQAYFQLTSGIARRVYELARKHCGAQASWSIALARLAEKIGYDADDGRNFKRFLAEVVERNDLPDYDIQIQQGADGRERPIASLRSHRGIKGLKAVFRRRNVLNRRVAQPAHPSTDIVLNRRAPGEPSSPGNVLNRRATAAPQRRGKPPTEQAADTPSEPEDMATPEDFRALIAKLEQASERMKVTGGKG